MPVFLRSLKYLKPYWHFVMITAAALLLSTLPSLTVPDLIRQAIDLGLARGDARLMALIGGGPIGVGLSEAAEDDGRKLRPAARKQAHEFAV